MKKIFYIAGSFLLLSLLISCAKDDSNDPNNEEVIESVEKVTLLLNVSKGEESGTTKTQGGSDPLMDYPYDKIYLTSSLLELGTLPITVNPATGEIEFYLITTSNGHYLSISDDPNRLDDKMQIYQGSEIYYFKSHLDRSVTLNVTSDISPCNSSLKIANPCGKHVYESKLFTMTIVAGGTITLSGDIFVRENGVDILKMDRLAGTFSPHIVFFYKDYLTAMEPKGLKDDPTDWHDNVNKTFIDLNLTGWTVRPFLDNAPSMITFNTAILSGDAVTIPLDDLSTYQKFEQRSFGVQVDGNSDGFTLDTYYSKPDSTNFIYSSDYNGKNAIVKFEVTSPDNQVKFLSVDFDINMTKNCVMYYYVLVNIYDLNATFYGNSTNSNAELRSSSVPDNGEIPVSYVWYETKPLE